MLLATTTYGLDLRRVQRAERTLDARIGDCVSLLL